MWAMPVESSGGVLNAAAEDLVLVVVFQGEQFSPGLVVAKHAYVDVQFWNIGLTR